jgi:hypothetical protein
MKSPARSVRGAAGALCLALVTALLAAAALPLSALASAPTWMVPAGGETWTAGTYHTIEWAGGGPNTTIFALVLVEIANPAFSNWVTVSAFFPNNGYIGFTIPVNVNPGAYKLMMGIDQDPGGPYDSPVFNIQAAPECLSGCYQVWASFPGPSPSFSAPPIGQCATSPSQAEAMAVAYIQNQLASQCGEGYSLDAGSVVIDVTLLPVGDCLIQESSGPMFVAEATGVGCCCQDAVPSTPQSWGTLKSLYR